MHPKYGWNGTVSRVFPLIALIAPGAFCHSTPGSAQDFNQRKPKGDGGKGTGRKTSRQFTTNATIGDILWHFPSPCYMDIKRHKIRHKMSRQFATTYDIFCPVPFLPSPFGFRRFKREWHVQRATHRGLLFVGVNSLGPAKTYKKWASFREPRIGGNKPWRP